MSVNTTSKNQHQNQLNDFSQNQVEFFIDTMEKFSVSSIPWKNFQDIDNSNNVQNYIQLPPENPKNNSSAQLLSIMSQSNLSLENYTKFPTRNSDIHNLPEQYGDNSADQIIDINSTQLEMYEQEYIDTTIFNSNVVLSSTKENCCIDVTYTEDIQIEEYNVLKKKMFHINKKQNVRMINTFKTDDNEKVFKCKCEITLTNNEMLFINELIQDDLKKLIKYLEDLVREKYKQINSVCPINFSCSRKNSNNIVNLYANCIYYREGCLKLKFVINLNETVMKILVFSTKIDIEHPEKEKKHQLRGVRRQIEKKYIKNMRAANWRDMQLYKRSKTLKNLGNDQNILSKAAARKLKSEEMRCNDRDPDNYNDLCKMFRSKNWNQYIQYVSFQDVYLFSKRQIKLTLLKKKELLKPDRNTLFFDATGSIIRKFEKNSKRIFLYSLVAHVTKCRNERGILLPVAEGFLSSHYTGDITRFLLFLETYCTKNGIKWPVAKRICTDWSRPIINSVIT